MKKNNCIVLITFIFLTICLRNDVFAKEANDKIVILHSYAKGLWSTEGTVGVKKCFKKFSANLDIVEILDDYATTDGIKNRDKMVREAIKKIKLISPKLIIIFDDEAADALVNKLNKLNIPIVITGINNNPEKIKWLLPDGNKDRNFTGIWEIYPFEQSLRILKKIIPTINEISILTSKNFTSRTVTSFIVDKFKKNNNYYSGVKLKNVHISDSWEEWKYIINKYKGINKAFWILVPWNVNDKKGREVDLRVMGTFYRKNSEIPSIGIVNINHQLGFLASFSVGAEDLGFQACEMAMKVIKNKVHPRDIKFERNKVIRFYINKKRSDHLGVKIPENLLDFATIEKTIPMQFVR